ncbi:MAG TPA: hypothetical protein VGS97_20240 [Actinocrinis sp.]|uniref:hypothetical protein n=1 Tax=Actinocrinis sp. TaxID=1920516 RepID=UPI002DDD6130|nr:hypothetical protein [Actinocrinis sp.]HEV2346440.1 hypothetical protein [Actinocrinis sp.]
MADTFTPNIGAIIADLNDVFNFGAHVEANFTLFDSLMGAVDCLSTARPTVTYKGQIVYEHDSLRYAQNTGTKASPVWTYMSHAAITGTSSSRPTSGLSAGELLFETDTQYLLSYTGSSWRHQSFCNYSVTSSSHPSSVFTGLEIYESDTGLSAVYNGSNFMYQVAQAAPTQTLGTTTASVTFSGLPTGVNAFKVRWSARCSDANAAEQFKVQLNGAVGSSYIWEVNQANNTTVAATTSAGASTFIQMGTVTAASATADYWASGEFTVDNGGASQFPNVQGTAAAFATTTNMWCGVYSGLYAVAGSVTSITMFGATGSFIAGSQFSIYALQ